jgi:hypothetical protein
MSDTRTLTNHGIAVVQNVADGLKEVLVCDAVLAGRPSNVYATHFKVQKVQVHPGVRLKHAGDLSYTQQVVEVSSEERGVVHVWPLGHGQALVTEARALRS